MRLGRFDEAQGEVAENPVKARGCRSRNVCGPGVLLVLKNAALFVA